MTPSLIDTTSGHLHQTDYDRRLAATYQGQAHIAGTGPEGTTCRECMWFARHGDQYHGVTLRDAWCTKPILNKAERLIPPTAASCIFYLENPDPPALKRRDMRRKVK